MQIKPSRILVFELNWMGDILFSFPLLRALRIAYPESYISCVVVPRYVDLLINNPWINDVHVLSDDNNITTIIEKLEFISMIKKEKYDTCFLLKPSRIKALMAMFAGIENRIGFAGKNSPLTCEIEMPPASIHRVDQLLALAAAMDISEADGTYEYYIPEEVDEKALEIIHGLNGGLNRIVALNPGGNWDLKRWPKENYIKFTKGLLDKFKDVEVIVTGAKKDIKLANEIVDEVDDKRCYSAAGITGPNELAGIFKRCELMISADSGPMHLASAVGVTTISLFGPTSADITGPRGKKNNIVIKGEVSCKVPCYVNKCPLNLDCMKSIKPEDVLKVAVRELSREQ